MIIKSEAVDNLIKQATACTSCDLHNGRDRLVFHKGSVDSGVVMLGEAPGQTEDATGVPFCGRSGKLLDNMIIAMGLKPEEVYVANIIKCHPPNNRKPTPQEMEACLPFLKEQLDIIKPMVIITLGATSTEGILGPGLGITKRRGQWGEYEGIPVMPTFHPAACLYNPKLKEDVWVDLQKVMERLRDV